MFGEIEELLDIFNRFAVNDSAVLLTDNFLPSTSFIFKIVLGWIFLIFLSMNQQD